MIDSFVKHITQNILSGWSNKISQSGMDDKKLIYFSFFFGVLSCLCVAFQAYMPALIFIALNRFFDSLAYGLNSHSNLVSIFDVSFFGGFIFFFSFGTTNTSMAALCLMFTYLLRLACTQKPSVQKNIVENTEIIIFMILCCLFPQIFAAIAILFAIICMVDAIKRFYDGTRT